LQFRHAADPDQARGGRWAVDDPDDADDACGGRKWWQHVEIGLDGYTRHD
jgi:hypothetical protein